MVIGIIFPCGLHPRPMLSPCPTPSPTPWLTHRGESEFQTCPRTFYCLERTPAKAARNCRTVPTCILRFTWTFATLETPRPPLSKAETPG